MCLLVVLSRVVPGLPLVVAANRDELLARPTTPMTVLRETEPRILGGRDELAGGTWMAVNEHGVMAALTNAPPGRAGRDPAKKSRGELPLRLAMHARAADAVDAFRREVHAGDYNPCWILCGDRDSLAYLDLTVPATPHVENLSPGVHVLENRPLHAPSPKADAVRAALAECAGWDRAALAARLESLLADHRIPPGVDGVHRGDPPRPVETEANCVHTELYGTRSSEIVLVDAAGSEPPRVRFTAGPSCTNPWQDAPAWRG